MRIILKAITFIILYYTRKWTNKKCSDEHV